MSNTSHDAHASIDAGYDLLWMHETRLENWAGIILENLLQKHKRPIECARVTIIAQVAFVLCLRLFFLIRKSAASPRTRKRSVAAFSRPVSADSIAQVFLHSPRFRCRDRRTERPCSQLALQCAPVNHLPSAGRGFVCWAQNAIQRFRVAQDSPRARKRLHLAGCTSAGSLLRCVRFQSRNLHGRLPGVLAVMLAIGPKSARLRSDAE